MNVRAVHCLAPAVLKLMLHVHEIHYKDLRRRLIQYANS
jgi:hypothetical protein